MKKDSASSTPRKTEILVAEDSPTQAAQIKHLLESNHYIVSVAYDGKQAIHWLSKHKPALVISDIMMPEMNGYELCKKIKSNKNTGNIPVILLTALSDTEEIIKGLTCGADSFISKPYNENYLISQIEKNLSEETGTNQAKVPFSTQILFKGKKRYVQAEQQKVIKLLVNIYEGAIQQNEKLIQTRDELRLLNERLESIVEDRTSDLSAEIKLSNRIIDRLRESEEIFDRFLQNSPIYIFFKDAGIRSLRLSRNYEQMLGKPLNELLGKRMDELFPSDFARRMIEDDLRILKEGKQVTLEEEFNGRSYTTTKFPIYHNDKPQYLAGFTIDVTESKKAEKAILDLNAQLEQRVIERTSQLEAANKELEAFAYSVSHDLRAPLRAVDGFSKFILEDYGDKIDSEGKRLLNLVRSNTKQMDQLITDLLALSRVNRNELKLSGIDMTQMVISAFDETAQDDIKNNIRFTVDQLPKAYADPAFLKQVWINLISNAIKFSSKKKNPEIKIGSKIETHTNTYFIKDNGAGFNQEYAHKLFGVFQRLHTSDDFEGTGIGLAIVQRIISRHGGKVWAEGEEGKGATFWFSLPVKK
ncbi:MAG: response regulator [Bacteroidales bacterium]|jgi:PAS domain S-box-containing protein